MRARRDDFAVDQLAFLGPRVDLGHRYALDAERALFHHARPAHRNVGVELQIERFGPFRREPVETAHLVRTVVLAEARADTAIVNLRVESFARMMRGEDRTDRLTRRVVALLAQDRRDVEVRRMAGLVGVRDKALDPHPGHDPAFVDLVLANEREIILGVARGDAGAAADT